jgi:predicted O-methyltransferase YrrM
VLADAGLADVVTLLEGDARETLNDLEAGIDFVFLDGWKGMYLPVLELLTPKLVEGALIAADNVDHEGARSYTEHVRASRAFVSHTLGKMELSCWTAASES